MTPETPPPEADLRARIARVFANPEHGTPDDISKAGCLALAKEGKDAWNLWRREHPVEFGEDGWENCADFSECNFPEGESISFGGFEFGAGASFKGARFVLAVFSSAQFGDDASFESALLGTFAQFGSARFDNDASFRNARFDIGAVFMGVHFGDDANFVNAQFGERASFNSAHFGKLARFDGAQFGNGTCFDVARFGDGASFRGGQWEQQVIDGEEGADRKARALEFGLSPIAFGIVSFVFCRFDGSAIFEGREFSGRATFLGTSFGFAPNFHGCKLHQDTSFDDAAFPTASGNLDAARAYRTLKLAFAQQQATREEQRFFRLEMAEEHLAAKRVKNLPKRLLFGAYKWLSDYGFSVSRPLLWLSLVWALGVAALLLIAPGGFQWQWEKIRSAFQLASIEVFPLPGLDRYTDDLHEALFGVGAPLGAKVMLIVMALKTAGAVTLFLVALALRNLFKMK